MATLTPECEDVYADVRSDASETDWAFLKYNSQNEIGVGGSGTGGVAALAPNFTDDECAFGYVRVTTGDEESKRAKFVFIAWTGDNAKIMRKARMSVHKANVKDVFREFAIELLASDQDDLDAEAIKTIKAGGANYMGQA
eukprot:CAMPEP_0116954854 /NCGR_PEP_ID=MMETSP0467-20121206/42229_1 /TAXON_ID=283647 /ORGANISM="Mesodinium pulex, Strain SPMC105" /LENGTH=139 /DNA_ID=CAMNT_0004640703 /DNA_START=31 /DNA_END=450 /DNA_ORIENTATION=+